MVRAAKTGDIPRIAEIIVFGKRCAYRSIFQDDRFSFNELQVMGLVRELRAQPDRLGGMLVYDDGIVKGVVGRTDFGQETELADFYVEPFFKGQGIGKALLGFWADGRELFVVGTEVLDQYYEKIILK